jgi:hypothetical protein
MGGREGLPLVMDGSVMMDKKGSSSVGFISCFYDTFVIF